MENALYIAGACALFLGFIFYRRRQILKRRHELDALHAAEPPACNTSDNFMCFLHKDGSTISGYGDAWVVKVERKKGD